MFRVCYYRRVALLRQKRGGAAGGLGARYTAALKQKYCAKKRVSNTACSLKQKNKGGEGWLSLSLSHPNGQQEFAKVQGVFRRRGQDDQARVAVRSTRSVHGSAQFASNFAKRHSTCREGHVLHLGKRGHSVAGEEGGGGGVTLGAPTPFNRWPRVPPESGGAKGVSTHGNAYHKLSPIDLASQQSRPERSDKPGGVALTEANCRKTTNFDCEAHFWRVFLRRELEFPANTKNDENATDT